MQTSVNDLDLQPQAHAREPQQALAQIKATGNAGIYVLLDFDPYLEDPALARMIKEIALGYGNAPHTLVFISHRLDMPAELIRKGRLDEIFFVDLPDAGTRERIFAIHLGKRSQSPEQFDLAALAAASDGFSGAEIEQAVVAGLYLAREQREALDTAHLQAELARTRPLSVVMAEQLAALRAWAAERTVPAH